MVYLLLAHVPDVALPLAAQVLGPVGRRPGDAAGWDYLPQAQRDGWADGGWWIERWPIVCVRALRFISNAKRNYKYNQNYNK